jgi:hypothetical protein
METLDGRSQWPPARSKAWTIFSRLYAGIVGSNPTQGMDVCVHLFCVYVEVAALRRTDPPSKESYRLCIDQESEKAAKVQQRAVDP